MRSTAVPEAIISEPIIAEPIIASHGQQTSMSANGQSLVIHEWSGSGPEYLHVHFADDEAWHVLEGTLTFRFADTEVEAAAGTTVFVPAGVAHTYYEAHGSTRYFIILTPRLHALIQELQSAPFAQHEAILSKYQSQKYQSQKYQSAKYKSG